MLTICFIATPISAYRTSIYTQLKNEFPNNYLLTPEQEKLKNLLDHPQLDFNLTHLSLEQQRTIALRLLAENDTTDKQEILDHVGRKDLELFNQANLHGILKKTNTIIGELTLAGMLATPTNNKKELRARQDIIKHLCENQDLCTAADDALKSINQSEVLYFELWQDMDTIKKDFINNLFYFPLLPSLNKNAAALEIKNKLFNSAIGLSIITPFIFLLGPAYQLYRAKNDLKESTWKNLTSSHKTFFIAAIVPAPITMNHSGTILKLMKDAAKNLQTQQIELASCINALRKLSSIITTHHLKGFEPITELFDNSDKQSPDKHSPEFRNLIKLLDTKTFKGEASFLSLTGRVLASYKMIQDVKGELRDALESAGTLDALLSITKLMKQSSARAQFCFVEFSEISKPHVALTKFWNPLLSPDAAVTNSIELGNTNANSMILTGPNTGGKSTIIKGIALNIVLAQTFGIAAAQSMKLTPFTVISTSINITDNIKENLSLFAAETARAKQVLTTMSSLKSDEFGFCVFDETFRGTAPDQAEKLSYWYAKELAKFDNAICLHATHYPSMVDLEQEAPSSCKNYKVEIEKLSNGLLQRDYLLKPGSTLANVAEEILKEQGLIK